MTKHNLPVAERLMLYVRKESECWIFTGRLNEGGYGSIWDGGKVSLAHRVAYCAFKGPIPPGMTVDHLCFTPACVNPQHLQLLTVSENAARQRKALSSHCARGHEFTPDNTLTQKNRTGSGRRSEYRLCRTCREESQARRTARRRAARRADAA